MANQIYMDADDPNNPGAYGKLYITNEVKYIADSIVDEDDTPHEKTVKFMEWTQDNIKFDVSPISMAHPHAIIKAGQGQCGSYSILVSSFLATQNIPSRVISMFHETNGHVIIEVYYDDKWHMYDPTFASYWKDFETGEILSFEELRNGGARNEHVCLVCDTNGKGLSFSSPETYETASPAGVIGTENPLWWELSIENEYVVPPIGQYDHGTRHIGASYINNCQTWAIHNLTPDEEYSFVITPKFVYGVDTFVLHVNETQSEYYIPKPDMVVEDVTVADANMLPVYINFTAHNETEILHLYHEYTGKDYIFMTVKRYEIVKI